METGIISAIITGSVAVVSPITTYVITRIYNRRVLGRIEGRRKALIGMWKGNIVQDQDQELGALTIEMNFTSSGKVVEGDCTFVSSLEGQVTKLKFTGGFYHEQFVKFDYTNPEEGVIQFGSALMTLDPGGKKLEGRYVGYGANTHKIVSGTVILSR